ncbi:hypothetical protein ACQKM9_08570 [Viridibacillus sp. NPDC093762]|uniref:hypothetical protein n=1 Tax=Viridibacillus sp. NPDC093762 TaxID=3390720 RepID=UPI003D05D5B9
MKSHMISYPLLIVKPKAFRIGHMGNITPEMLEEAIVKIGETLQKLGHEVDIVGACKQFKEMILTTV